jgi:hypothetical protein
MKKYYFILFNLTLYLTAFSQITEITQLPYQDLSQSITESVPVWISENEIIVFYVSEQKDTIYFVKSNDRGIS